MSEQDTSVFSSGASIGSDAESTTPDPDIDPYIEREPDPEVGVFDIGLVLAGAISAGAYSAGVLDYLVEALDAWEAAKSEKQDVPMHRVRIRVIAGASAGSMNGAIAAVALQYDFHHVRSGDSGESNPFYDAWVKRISIDKLLAVHDLVGESPVVRSALDSTILQSITDDSLNYQAKVKHRPYLEGRVRFIFTQGGLRGIPYFLKLNGNTNEGLAMSLHKSYRSFSIGFNGMPIRRRPDDMPLATDIGQPKATDAGWASLGNAALGSGAFPIGLAPRLEKRNVADLNWRYVTGVGDKPIWLTPAWASTLNGVTPTPPYPCFDEFVVDGGTMDNELLDLARAEMAGTVARNERNGLLAKRALIMIDPFADALTTDFNKQESGRSGNLISSGIGLLGAWKNQARFNPVDLALALDDSVFSRFLIAPSRKRSDGTRDPSSAFDLASGALGGFGGFLDEEYRRHDYLLGRRNCQQFLANYFTLPGPILFSPKTRCFVNAGRSQRTRKFPSFPPWGHWRTPNHCLRGLPVPSTSKH
ncbi:patatin-like phospholipase [Paraburkholderia silvatlantica]|uniref:Patatin-like phospholipase n=1 Tax=Paraburkholderia silvatlantica TaxID=321895 RepID=A0A2V4SYL4_9BURK|nr:patatin-like phospholipase family protein [Paraburkholderia silvatlantica]PYE14091.1 patatin-like phospholipase [Paraburkholderia silvatlantica]